MAHGCLQKGNAIAMDQTTGAKEQVTPLQKATNFNWEILYFLQHCIYLKVKIIGHFLIQSCNRMVPPLKTKY